MSAQDRFIATKIPVNEIEQMSPEEIVDACLTYPFIYGIFACDNKLSCADYLVRNSSAFSALEGNRENCIAFLNQYYSKIGEYTENSNKREIIKLGMTVSVMELILARSQVFQMLPLEENLKLLKSASEPISRHDDPAGEKREIKTLLMGNVVKFLQNNSKSMEVKFSDKSSHFLATGTGYSPELFDEIRVLVLAYFDNEG